MMSLDNYLDDQAEKQRIYEEACEYVEKNLIKDLDLDEWAVILEELGMTILDITPDNLNESIRRTAFKLYFDEKVEEREEHYTTCGGI